MATKPFFCEECSTRNTPDSKYCKECGASLHAAYQTLALSDHDRIDDPTDQERLTQFLDMAFWHNEAGNTDAAVRACKAALALNANSTTALSLLGSLCERQGDNAQAIGYFERVLALNPDSAADRVKLTQLQEGIHVAPVRASPVYRWLPFAFGTAGFSQMALAMRARWAELQRPEMPVLPPRSRWALASGVAAILVLTIGLFLVKPSSPGVSAEAATAPQPVAHSAFGGAQAPPPTPTASVPPIVNLPARPGTPLAPMPSVVASVPPTADPFAGETPIPMTSGPVFGRPRARSGTRRVTSSDGLRALPPLVAVPSADNGPLPPAPVIIEPNAPMPPDSDIARHTVVVHRLGGLSEFTPPGAVSASDNGDGGSVDTTPEPQSHIQITVDPGPSGDASNAPASSSGGSSGEADQQSAFALQQQGRFRQAAALYSRAIAAYQSELASGQDVDAAQRGLQACQTGLLICRQSQ